MTQGVSRATVPPEALGEGPSSSLPVSGGSNVPWVCGRITVADHSSQGLLLCTYKDTCHRSNFTSTDTQETSIQSQNIPSAREGPAPLSH